MIDDQRLIKYLDFIQNAEKLKSTTRRAYTATGRRESAAEHSWRLALMALILEGEFKGLDNHRILKLCLVHDLGEAIHGDVSALDQADDDSKANLERQDIIELTSALDKKDQDEILALWDEYDQGRTAEARLVKGLDKLETLIQHNQGQNPPGAIDFKFNLEYGRQYMSGHPLFTRLRQMVDEVTAQKVSDSEKAL